MRSASNPGTWHVSFYFRQIAYASPLRMREKIKRKGSNVTHETTDTQAKRSAILKRKERNAFHFKRKERDTFYFLVISSHIMILESW